MNEKKGLCKHKEELLLKCKDLVENPPVGHASLLTQRTPFFTLATINTLLKDCEKCKED